MKLINPTVFICYWLGLLPLVVKCIIPNVPDLSSRDSDEPGHQSLPNLLHADSIKNLELTWDTLSDIKLDTGRLLIGPGKGSIWSKSSLESSSEEWTLELLFRSSGTARRDAAFGESNGISFWLLQSPNKISSALDQSNFGGPSVFDGFQFLINSHEYNGLKIFVNDGSKKIKNLESEAAGSCKFNYFDSSVPFSIRISYSKKDNWFKIQVDNELCFKTDSLTIPANGNDFKFGVSASVDSNSEEVFEVFKINAWNHLTNDAKDDHGLIIDGVKYKVEQGKDPVQPSYNRKSLMERNRQLQKNVGPASSLSGNLQSSMEMILTKLDELETEMKSSKVGTINQQSHSNDDFGVILEDIKRMQFESRETLNEIRREISSIGTTLSPFLKEFLQSISKINENLVNEVREYQHGNEQIDRKVDLLMANHKEIAYMYEHGNNNDSFGVLSTIIRYVLVAVVVGIMALIVIIYRLRHDIKHSKLL